MREQEGAALGREAGVERERARPSSKRLSWLPSLSSPITRTPCQRRRRSSSACVTGPSSSASASASAERSIASM
jgi:hypothetical protein